MNGFPASIVIAALAAASPACGGDDVQPGAGVADAATPDAEEPDAIPTDAEEPDAGTPDAEEADAGPVPSRLLIDRVYIDGVPDGQIRQGGAATLVIEGRGLFEILSVGIDSAVVAPTGGIDTARTWRVELPHGQAIGDTPLRLATTTGTQDLSAITVTPIVHAPDGRPDGRGTYASPVSICRGDDTSLLVRATDTMVLLAGRYDCSHRLFVLPGVIVRGEGLDRTVLAGAAAGVTARDGAGTTELHDLTIAGGAANVAVLLRGGDAVIDGVAVESGSTGIVATAGRVTIRDTHINVTGDGIVVGASGGDGEGAAVTMTGSSIQANRAIDAFEGSVTVDGGTLKGADDEADTGVRYDSAAVNLRNTTLAGFDAGIEMYLGPGALGGATIVLEGATIGARQVGIVVPGLRAGSLTVRRSHVEGLTAVTVIGTPRLLDFGTHDTPGENALVGSFYAIDDLRIVSGPTISAVGSTLNGTSGSGSSIVGPVDAPPLYRLRVATELAF